jgi:hypothetical protein
MIIALSHKVWGHVLLAIDNWNSCVCLYVYLYAYSKLEMLIIILKQFSSTAYHYKQDLRWLRCLSIILFIISTVPTKDKLIIIQGDN